MTNNQHAEIIEGKVMQIRGQRVILDHDLAEIYDVDVSILNRAFNENIGLHREALMFSLTREELLSLPPSSIRGGMDFDSCVNAYTERGVVLLSGILDSERAAIMRAFVKLREVLESKKKLYLLLDRMERKYDRKFGAVFDVIRELMMRHDSLDH